MRDPSTVCAAQDDGMGRWLSGPNVLLARGSRGHSLGGRSA
ncbi:MAG: hypothetical protein ACR2F0_00875 [Chthoniobacterales bacterium]